MRRNIIDFAGRRPTLLFVVFAAATIAVVVVQVNLVIENTRRSTALEAAISYSNAVSSIRNYYASVVVPRAKAAGVTVTQNYHENDDAIPVPATVTIELGESVSRTNEGGSFRLLSSFPFLTRSNGGPRDDFEREALAAFGQGSANQFVRIHENRGLAELRFAQPVHMKESCVACHNSHPDSPRNDWQVGDLRGIQTVSVPLPNTGILATIANGEYEFLNNVALVAIALLVGLALIGLLLNGLRNSLRQRENLLVLAESRNVELSAANETAEQANRAKTQFLATVSHELRTPLNAVIGFSEAIESALHGPVGDPQYEEYARQINKSGQHLHEIISSILDLSKIEAGKFELHETDVEVGHAVEVCLSVVAERARTANISIKTEVPDDLPPLFGDERTIRQILLNLLSNAIKFSKPGANVVVTARSSASEGYVVEVVDTGIGMSAEEIAVAVEPFAQVDGALNRQFDGTGLGLPLAKKFAELHGGTLDIESASGRGTTVTVRFPASRIVHDYEAVA